MTAELGPYIRNIQFKVRTFTRHIDGGDSSTASMQLFYDDKMVGEHADQHFHTADLKVEYAFFLSAGSTADLRIATTNKGATVDPDPDKHGFDLWWTFA